MHVAQSKYVADAASWLGPEQGCVELRRHRMMHAALDAGLKTLDEVGTCALGPRQASQRIKRAGKKKHLKNRCHQYGVLAARNLAGNHEYPSSRR